MGEGDAPVLHLIDGVTLASDDQPRRGGAEGAAILALRAARLLLDRRDRADRARVGAAVVNHPEGEPRTVREITDFVCGGLPLAAPMRFPVAGLGGPGVFAALHVARAAVLCGVEEVLLVSFSEAAVGASLLGSRGGVACRPMPPSRAAIEQAAGARAQARSSGEALARMVEQGGMRRRDLKHAASPGLARVEAAGLLREAGLSHVLGPGRRSELAGAASVEEALALAAANAPAAPTLLWAYATDGAVSGCVLQEG